LQIRDLDLLIEDLEPLTQSRTLKSIDADIAATREEQQEFSARHPNIVVNWPEPNSNMPGAMQPGDRITPADVAIVLFERWRVEDCIVDPVQVFDPAPSSLGFEQMSQTREQTWRITRLDFSQLKLSRARLERIPIKKFPEVTTILFGRVDSVDTALNLIRRCGGLRELDARHVPFNKKDLETLQLQPQASLCLQQSSLTADDICELVQRFNLNTLRVYASSFSDAELQRIKELKNCSAALYRGFADDENERLDYVDEEMRAIQNLFQ
jgi:hypothetical protein